MNPPDVDTRLPRRALLAGAAGLAGSALVPRTRGAPPTLSVMTRNLYLGVDLAELFRARSRDDLRRIAGEMLTQIRSHPYAARVDAIASEVAATTPDVVCVQEAATLRVQTDSDFAEEPGPNAPTVVVDLLDTFTTKLAARGPDYEVETATVTTDVEVPAEDGDSLTDVRLTDRLALLVRSDVDADTSHTGRFESALQFPLGGTSIALRRGYCLADVTVGDTDVTVANTHLESVDETTRTAQATELLDRLPTDQPAVLAGDLNSGPGGSTAAYDLLTDSFEDPYGSDSTGYTCCQANDLRNEASDLSRRVDHVLSRGGLRPAAVERVGVDPESKVTADVDGETVSLWPSDHAGVMSTFEIHGSTPTATSTATPTDPQNSPSTGTTTPTPGPDRPPKLPLYGSLAGIGGLGLGLLAWYRRNR